MYKIYQLQRINEVITHIEDNDYSEYDIKLNVIAEWSEKNQIDVQKAIEDVWHGCNVDCWDSEWKDNEPVVLEDITIYPTPEFKGYCNSDIIVETKEGLYIAESFGWKKAETLKEAEYRIIWSFTFINWNDIRNKADYSLDELKEIGKIINKERKEKYESKS